jgi:hypothetical protein
LARGVIGVVDKRVPPPPLLSGDDAEYELKTFKKFINYKKIIILKKK